MLGHMLGSLGTHDSPMRANGQLIMVMMVIIMVMVMIWWCANANDTHASPTRADDDNGIAI